MAKIVCESCQTSFLFEVVKDLKECPVCGEALWDNEESESIDDERTEDEEDGLMYFDEIAIKYKENPEYNGVCAYCGECGKSNSLALDKFDKLIDKEYVILKKDITVTCRGCGKEHKPRKIKYKLKDHYAPPLPRCPVCDSYMIKKLSAGSKLLAAATIGMFALPYSSKTFECKNCGYRF